MVVSQDQFDILAPKNGQVEDLLDALVKKAKIPSEDEAGPIRVYEVSNHKFFRELDRNYPVISINEYTTVVAERIPAEEVGLNDPAQFISVFQFHGEPSRAHGIPFRFLIKEGEMFSETKKRLEKRTGLKGKSFEKIKFAVVRRAQFSRPQYLTDGKQATPHPQHFLGHAGLAANGVADDILWDVAQNSDDILGMDHPDRTRSVRNGAGDLFLKG